MRLQAQEYSSLHPLTPKLPAKPLLLTLPPTPPLRGFPAWPLHHQQQPSTSGAEADAQGPYGEEWGLRFHLVADLQSVGVAGKRSWLLAMMLCTSRGLPVQVSAPPSITPRRSCRALAAPICLQRFLPHCTKIDAVLHPSVPAHHASHNQRALAQHPVRWWAPGGQRY